MRPRRSPVQVSVGSTPDPARELPRSLPRDADGTPATALSPGEREFLLTHAGMSEFDLSEQARAVTRLDLTLDRRTLDAAALDSALSTREVAALLGRTEASVRRSRRYGDLYALNPGDPTGQRFPRWQFISTGRLLPGLRRILSGFPRDTHPLAIARFMTQIHGDLDGISPVEWLANNGAVDPLASLVEDLGYV